LLVSALDPCVSKFPIEVREGNSKFVLDAAIDSYYKKHLKKIFDHFVYLSEESGPIIVGAARLEDVDKILLVDPLDTSEMAVRGLVGWTHLAVIDRYSGDTIGSIVGDFFHPLQIFYALKEGYLTGAYVRTSWGSDIKLHPSRVKSLQHALVTSFTMKPKERFLRLARESVFLDAVSKKDEGGWSLGRIGLSFGSIGMCHVAAGITDAFIEIVKGFQMWDLLPGLLILKLAGGCVINMNGSDINPRLQFRSLDDISGFMRTRKKFIASGTIELAQEILTSLRPTS
jgi:myo-inositol-1(or 4)-monophosphatase